MAVPMKPGDPAYWMLEKGREEQAAGVEPDEGTWVTKQEVYREDCYICNDPEFALMGLPLCKKCPSCPDGHIPADDPICDDCEFDLQEAYMEGKI